MLTNPLPNRPPYIYDSAYRRPYLNLKERLSQVWLNYYTVFILLILIKVILFKKSLDNSLDQAKDKTYSVCNSAEIYASSLASIPYYLARSTNTLSAKAMNEVNSAFVEGLKLILTGSENLIFFAIEMTIGTYTCVLTSAIGGATHIALNATESVIELANKTMMTVADDIEDGLADISTLVNKVIEKVDSAVDGIENLFSDDDDSESDIDNKLNSVNLTISSLKDWKISSSVTEKINEVGDKIPDFDDVENFTKKLIDVPFQKLRTEITENLNDTFSADQMLVPSKKQLSFCRSSNDIEDFYNKSAKSLHNASIVIMVILIITMIAFICIEAYGVIRDWKHIQDASESIQKINEMSVNGDYKFNHNIEVIDTLQHRYSAKIGSWLGKLIGSNNIKTNNARWIFNYITSSTALNLLLLGIAGIFAFILQTIMLKVVSSSRTNDLKEVFTSVAKDVQNNITNDIDLWVNDTNDYIKLQQDTINNDLFGWVNTTTYTINETVTDFIDKMNDSIEDIFGDTILYDSIENIVGCVITRKLENIQKAMTWLSNNANITFPSIDRDNITNSITDDSEDGQSMDDGVSDYLDDIKDALKKVWQKIVKEYKESLYTELWISVSLIGAWFLLVIIGFILLYINEKQMNRKLNQDQTFGTFDDSLTPYISEEEKLKDKSLDTDTTKYTNMSSTTIENLSKKSLQNTPKQQSDGSLINQDETPLSNHFKGSGMINQTLTQLVDKIRDNSKKRGLTDILSAKEDSRITLTPDNQIQTTTNRQLSPGFSKDRNWRIVDPILYEKMVSGESLNELDNLKNKYDQYDNAQKYLFPTHYASPPSVKIRSNSWNNLSSSSSLKLHGLPHQPKHSISNDSSVDCSFIDSTIEGARKWDA